MEVPLEAERNPSVNVNATEIETRIGEGIGLRMGLCARDTPRRSHRDNTSDNGIARRDGHHVLSSVDRKPPRKGSSSLPTAVDTKVAIKRRLQKVAAADASPKTGVTFTVAGGAGWERAEMSTASDFFESDEVAAKGGVASVMVGNILAPPDWVDSLYGHQ